MGKWLGRGSGDAVPINEAAKRIAGLLPKETKEQLKKKVDDLKRQAALKVLERVGKAIAKVEKEVEKVKEKYKNKK